MDIGRVLQSISSESELSTTIVRVKNPIRFTRYLRNYFLFIAIELNTNVTLVFAWLSWERTFVQEKSGFRLGRLAGALQRGTGSHFLNCLTDAYAISRMHPSKRRIAILASSAVNTWNASAEVRALDSVHPAFPTYDSVWSWKSCEEGFGINGR